MPKEYQKLLKRLYNVVEAGNVTEFEINLLIIGDIINKLHEKRKKHLSSAVRLLHAKKEEILAHAANPFIHNTNNLNESYHEKYIRYSPFKRQMKTKWGVRFHSDITRFTHNFERFKTYIDEFWQRKNEFKVLKQDLKYNKRLIGRLNRLLYEKKELEYGFGEYLKIWKQYFCKI